MKTIWRRFESFLYFDYQGIRRHLEKMAMAGWQLSGIPIFYWEYHKTEPKKLRYTVTYFPKPSFPYPTEAQQAFYDSCKDAGWELVAQKNKMQIFCATREDAAPIETNERAKLQMVHRVMKKDLYFGWLLPLFLAYQFYFVITEITKNPIYNLSSNAILFSVAIWPLIIVSACIYIISYVRWYLKSKKSVEGGGACANCDSAARAHRLMLRLSIAAFLFLIFLLIREDSGSIRALIFATIAVVFLLARKARSAVKWGEAAGRASPTVTVAVCAAGAILLTGAATFYIAEEVRAGRAARQPALTYTFATPRGYFDTWDIYRDPLPLRVEDMTDVDYDHYSYEWRSDSTFLLSCHHGHQRSFEDGQSAPKLSYTITDVKLPVLYDLCLSGSLENPYYYFKDEKRGYRQTDDPLWQADAVYQLYYDNEPLNDYLLSWGSRIVTIHFDFAPTAAQVAIAAEKLRA